MRDASPKFAYVTDGDVNDKIMRDGRSPIASYVGANKLLIYVYENNKDLQEVLNGEKVYLSNKLIFPKSIEGVMR